MKHRETPAPNIACSLITAQDTQDQVIWKPSRISTAASRHTYTMSGAALTEPLWVEIEGEFVKSTGGSGVAGVVKPDFQVTVPNVASVSVYSTQEGCFARYAQRCTPGEMFAFATGKQFLEGLVAKTTEYGQIGDLYIFSHA